MRTVCVDATKSAGGLDNFTPEDFTYLSDSTYEWIATLLNIIEDGGTWPQELLLGRAAFLSKDPDDTEKVGHCSARRHAGMGTDLETPCYVCKR